MAAAPAEQYSSARRAGSMSGSSSPADGAMRFISEMTAIPGALLIAFASEIAGGASSARSRNLAIRCLAPGLLHAKTLRFNDPVEDADGSCLLDK